MRLILRRSLTDLGFSVVEASHGREALDLLEQPSPLDLILVDWSMPVMNGIEFVRSVRRQPRFNHLRIMMVTTETEISCVSEALEAGADEYVMKPFTPAILQDKLRLIGAVS
jgi:two-component system chemotaxis response regulator CheY